MKELDNILPKISTYFSKFASSVIKHRVILTVIIACAAIFASVIQAQEFLNPVRNENLYTEQKSGANIKTIDSDIVNKLQETQSDVDISVDSDFVPDRNNPFNE